MESAAHHLAAGIQESLDAGYIQRQDEFFEGDDVFSSDGAQLLEGVLLKCRAQYQEKKVRIIANIFKSVAFNANISPSMAYQVLSLADELTYQKLCLLSYYGRRPEFAGFNIFNDPILWYPHVSFSNEMLVVVQDLLEMHNQGIIKNDVLTVDSSHIMAGGITLTARGQMAFDLLELRQINERDVLEAIQPLAYQTSWGKSTSGTVNGVYDVT